MDAPELSELQKEVSRIHDNPAVRRRERRKVYAKVRSYYLARRKEEATQGEIARELGLPVATLYRWIRAYWTLPTRSVLDIVAEKGPQAVR